MSAPDVTALQRSDLNDFLFADVGAEASGMMLSVVSLFARQGTDPWREADRLAVLPKAAAADSLAHAIADMPQGRWTLPDASVIAARLTSLLPARPARVIRRAPVTAADWLPSARTAVVMAFVALGIIYAVSTLLRPAPLQFDGGDVGSFASAPAHTTSPAGDVPAIAGPTSR